MHSIRKDIKYNRIYITLHGVIPFDEAMKVKEKLFKEVEGLQPGFDVVNDISKLISADEKAAKFLEEVNKYFVFKKVKRIIRVVGHSKAGLVLFAKHSPKYDGVEIKYVPTLKEAEDMLNGI